MNVDCVVMFEFNYSVGDIKNSDLGEGIVCLGEGSGGQGEGSGDRGREVGKRGREVGVRAEGSGECLPPCPPPHKTIVFVYNCHSFPIPTKSVNCG